MSGFYLGSAKKLFRLKSGGIIGVAGNADCRAIISLFDNIKDEGDLPSKADLEATRTDGEYILILPDKTVWSINIDLHDESGRFYAQLYPARGKVAAGHGEHFAIAAMGLGKTAEEAVREACKWSLACKPPVQSMKLEDKPKQKIKRTRHPKPSPHMIEE